MWRWVVAWRSGLPEPGLEFRQVEHAQRLASIEYNAIDRQLTAVE